MAEDPTPSSEETTQATPNGSETLESEAQVPTGPEFRQLHPALRKVWILSGLLTALPLAVGVGVVEYLGLADAEGWPLPTFALAAGVLLLLGGHALVFSTWRYRAWRYAVRPHDVLLHHGVIWRTRVCIPRLRIQHVDIESGPIDRAFGIVELSLYTAGTISAVGTIPGLLPEEAEALRETLLQTDRADG